MDEYELKRLALTRIVKEYGEVEAEKKRRQKRENEFIKNDLGKRKRLSKKEVDAILKRKKFIDKMKIQFGDNWKETLLKFLEDA